MRNLVHTYIKTPLIVYVKLKFNWCPVFYQVTLLPKATVSLSMGLVGHFGGCREDTSILGSRGYQIHWCLGAGPWKCPLAHRDPKRLPQL